MTHAFRLVLLILVTLACSAASARAGADWEQIDHGGLSFSLPAEWGVLKQDEFEGQWGIRSEKARQAIGFVLARERHPERDLKSAAKDGLDVVSLGETDVGGLSVEQHRISGRVEDDEVFIRLAIVAGLLPDGSRVAFSATAIGYPQDEVRPVLEQVMASVRPTADLVATLTGYARHSVFDGLIEVETRNNWEMSDSGDRVDWEPPLFSLYGARFVQFVKGYSLAGSNGLLSKLDDPVLERTEMFGLPGWRISGTGVAIAYVGVMRNKTVPATTRVFVPDVCLDRGERFGYAVSATDEQLAEHQEALQRLVDSVKLALPDAAGPCDEPVSYAWSKGMNIAVPRSWRKNQDADYHLSWYDRVIPTGADIALYISHAGATRHPLIGEGYPPVDTLGSLHVDGYPATHYRKQVTGSDKVETTYDYYVLDTPMRTERGGRTSDNAYLYFQFSTRPSAAAEPDVEMQRAVLATVRLDDTWVSETPVVRAPRPTAMPGPDRGMSSAVVGTPVARDDAAASSPSAAETEKEAAVVDGASAGPASPPPGVAGAAPRPAEEPAPAAPTQSGLVSTKPVLADYEQAKRLREQGASLQQQGSLVEAVSKYRESLSLYPDERLEAHVRRIEAMLGDMGDK